MLDWCFVFFSLHFSTGLPWYETGLSTPSTHHLESCVAVFRINLCISFSPLFRLEHWCAQHYLTEPNNPTTNVQGRASASAPQPAAVPPRRKLQPVAVTSGPTTRPERRHPVLDGPVQKKSKRKQVRICFCRAALNCRLVVLWHRYFLLIRTFHARVILWTLLSCNMPYHEIISCPPIHELFFRETRTRSTM